MVNLEYHKGQPCAYKPIFCQEGFCSECIISLEQPPQMISASPEENNLFAFKRNVYKKNLLKARV